LVRLACDHPIKRVPEDRLDLLVPAPGGIRLGVYAGGLCQLCEHGKPFDTDKEEDGMTLSDLSLVRAVSEKPRTLDRLGIVFVVADSSESRSVKGRSTGRSNSDGPAVAKAEDKTIGARIKLSTHAVGSRPRAVFSS
jgi:hypothetical protein